MQFNSFTLKKTTSNHLFKHSFLFLLLTISYQQPLLASPTEQCIKKFHNFPMAAAIPFCKEAAKQGHAEAQTRLGTYYAYKGSNKEEGLKGVSWLLKAAKQNHADAQFILGILYDLGRPLDKDKAKAIAWYKKAAEQGHPEASFNLGLLYFLNYSQPKIRGESLKWFKHAAKYNNSFAQHNLGLIYYNGKIVKQNYNESVKWFKLAAEQGYPRSQHNMGMAYLFGRGINKDYVKARDWFKKAAIKKYAFSQYALGTIFQYGLGVKQDIEAAKYWYNRPASKRYQNSLNALQFIKSNAIMPVETSLKKIDMSTFHVLEKIIRLPRPNIHYDNPCEELTDSKFTLNKNEAYKNILKKCELRVEKNNFAKDIFLFATSKFDNQSTGLLKQERSPKEFSNLKSRIHLERKSAEMGFFDAQYDLGTICLMFDHKKELCKNNEVEKWIQLAAKQSQPSLYCMANQIYPANTDKQLQWFTMAVKANESCGAEKIALHYIKENEKSLPLAQAWHDHFLSSTEKLVKQENTNAMPLQMMVMYFKELYNSAKGSSKMDEKQKLMSSKYLEDIQNNKFDSTGIPQSFK